MSAESGQASATPGYNTIVIGGGILQFEVPTGWVALAGEDSIKLLDRMPPHDSVALDVQTFRIPPLKESAPPLRDFLKRALRSNGLEFPDAEFKLIEGNGFELALVEYSDAAEPGGRTTCWRQALCRRDSVCGYFTFGCWQEMTEIGDAIWRHVVRTISLGHDS